MADGPQWEQLLRNGQLTWRQNELHKEMLIRFYHFFENTADVSLFDEKYPGFVQEVIEPARKPKKADPKVEVVEVTEEVPVDEPTVEPKKKRSRKKSTSPSE